ncbi:MAG TPA: RodZ domain-containing protein [Actinomycetes bacterium]|nr:RodZ domain-containing protein [Actinomycetes bacterium]
MSRLPSIGEALRSAREAQGKSVEEASAATRIRPSYLEALEQERFDELGGNVYAKGFLRSYASFLGVDPAPLLEAYRAQERPDAPLFESAPKAIATRAGGRRGPTWVAAAIVAVSIILVVSLWSLLRPATDPTNTQPPFAPEPATTAPGASTTAPPTTARAAPRGVTVTLRYAAPSWTRVTADGSVSFEGIPGSGVRRTFRARRSIDLILGAPGVVRLTVNGKDLGVPDRSGAIWRHSFTPGEPTLR